MFKLAKEIRQSGEKWQDAVKRAAAQIKGGNCECPVPKMGAGKSQKGAGEDEVEKLWDRLGKDDAFRFLATLSGSKKMKKMSKSEFKIASETLGIPTFTGETIVEMRKRAKDFLEFEPKQIKMMLAEKTKQKAGPSKEIVVKEPEQTSRRSEPKLIEDGKEPVTEQSALTKLLNADKKAIKELSSKIGMELVGPGPYYNSDINLQDLLMGLNAEVEETLKDSILDEYDDDEQFKAEIKYTVYQNGNPRRKTHKRNIAVGTLKNIMSFLDIFYSPSHRIKPKNVYNIIIDVPSYEQMKKLVNEKGEVQAIRIDSIQATNGAVDVTEA